MDIGQNAIAILYRKHWRKLYVHACNLLNDEEDAKDVVNDVFCSVLENSGQFKEEKELLPLFYVMVRNRCIDYLRHQNVVHKNESKFLEEFYSDCTVVEEFFLNEKKCGEISEKLRISDNTVRTHIARALKILRRRLK